MIERILFAIIVVIILDLIHFAVDKYIIKDEDMKEIKYSFFWYEKFCERKYMKNK